MFKTEPQNRFEAACDVISLSAILIITFSLNITGNMPVGSAGLGTLFCIVLISIWYVIRFFTSHLFTAIVFCLLLVFNFSGGLWTFSHAEVPMAEFIKTSPEMEQFRQDYRQDPLTMPDWDSDVRKTIDHYNSALKDSWDKFNRCFGGRTKHFSVLNGSEDAYNLMHDYFEKNHNGKNPPVPYWFGTEHQIDEKMTLSYEHPELTLHDLFPCLPENEEQDISLKVTKSLSISASTPTPSR